MQPDVAVIVVTYNSAGVVLDLLDSLPAGLDGLSADVVVVDNSSTDATAELLDARDDCRVVRAPNHGYAAGINAGVRHAAHPVTALQAEGEQAFAKDMRYLWAFTVVIKRDRDHDRGVHRYRHYDRGLHRGWSRGHHYGWRNHRAEKVVIIKKRRHHQFD